MDYLHRHGVKGYITLNTLVFSRELEDFERAAQTAIAAGVDAALVQDLGAARLLAELCPDWPLHASTQMSLSSGEAIRAAGPGDLAGGVAAGTVAGRNPANSPETPLGLEVFVHGALCIAFSGQCMASFALGGRSATAAAAPSRAASLTS